MKVGIGITTTPQREYAFSLCRTKISQHTFMDDVVMFSVCDEDNKGVAHQKNLCLNYLFNISKCDVVFLFDDDCFPIADGWMEHYINTSNESKQGHLIYCKPSINNELVRTESGVDVFNNCNGCLSFITKEGFEKAGYYNEAFGQYGFEHADHSNRINWAGVNTIGMYLCPVNAGRYIYSLDLDSHIPELNIGHKPSIKPAVALDYIRKAQKVYMDSLDKKQIYFPFEQ